MRQLHIKEALQVPLKYRFSSLKKMCMYAIANQNISYSSLLLDLSVHKSTKVKLTSFKAEIDTYKTQDIEYRCQLLGELSTCFASEDDAIAAEVFHNDW